MKPPIYRTPPCGVFGSFPKQTKTHTAFQNARFQYAAQCGQLGSGGAHPLISATAGIGRLYKLPQCFIILLGVYGEKIFWVHLGEHPFFGV